MSVDKNWGLVLARMADAQKGARNLSRALDTMLEDYARAHDGTPSTPAELEHQAFYQNLRRQSVQFSALLNAHIQSMVQSL